MPRGADAGHLLATKPVQIGVSVAQPRTTEVPLPPLRAWQRAALSAYLAEENVPVYVVSPRGLLSDTDLTSNERMVIRRWADRRHGCGRLAQPFCSVRSALQHLRPDQCDH